MVEKRLGYKWSGFWMGSKSGSPTIWNPDKWLPFWQKPLEIRTKISRFWMVRFPNCWTIAIAKAPPFENRTIWNPTFKKSGFRMVRFQIPTVLQSSIVCQNLTSWLTWLTPEWVVGGGNEQPMVVFEAGLSGRLSMSGRPGGLGRLRFAGDKLRMGWCSVNVTLVLVS